jgi:hypothetical protein
MGVLSSLSTTQKTTYRATRQRRLSSCSIGRLLSFKIAFLILMTTMMMMMMIQQLVARGIDCDLYIAKSTIPQAGLGIFTAVAKSKGDSIGNGDKAIPIVDLYWHNGYYDEGNDEEVEESIDIFDPLKDYLWHGIGMGMDYESENDDDISAFWPGIDAMVNCHAGLVNAEKATPVYNEVGMHRNVHPGAGAVTPYSASLTTVIRDIPAGGEIFKEYGDDWFTSRDKFWDIPLPDNYADIVTLMSDFRTMMEDLELSEKQSAVIYDELILPMKKIWKSRTLNALHDFSWEDMKRAIIAQDIGVLLQKNATRSIDWLDEHGKCIDHIIFGRSTIEGAG